MKKKSITLAAFKPPPRTDLFTKERPNGCVKLELDKGDTNIGLIEACPATAKVDGESIDTMQIEFIGVAPEWRNKGVSTYLTERMAWRSEGQGRALQSDFSISAERDPFWQKQVRKGRVAHIVKDDRGRSSYILPLPAPDSLDGLPRTGRIPLATARRALKSLGRKATACRITPEALREGMEVEREHRDVTRGGMLKTAKIAAAHLCESSRYYKELKKVERKLKRGK